MDRVDRRQPRAAGTRPGDDTGQLDAGRRHRDDEDTAYDGTGRWLWDLDQSDPRINGVVEGAVEEIGSARSDGSIDYLASNTITNQDGSWDTPSGPIAVRGPAPVFEHFMYSTSTGSGAYEGLTYHSFWYFPEPTNMQVGDEFVWSGWIEEAR